MRRITLVCMFEEHRIEPRERLALPIKLSDGLRALTRNISPTGLYFEIEGERLMHGLVDFEMQLAEAGMKFTAVGEIVRVDHHSGKTGVAVRLMAPRLELINDGPAGINVL
jgi:hypothetical protein